MNITIFGGSGAIGKLFVKKALDNGDKVIAYVRKKTSINLEHKNLHLIIGELTNKEMIEKAIENADVVVSTLGSPLDMSRKIKGSPIADGHKLIVEVMKKYDKKRFITLGTPSIKASEDGNNISFSIIGTMAKLLYPTAFAEMKKIEELIKNSNLHWTVVRIINPNVVHKKDSYSYSFGDKSFGFSVSRENTANFIYDILEAKEFFNKMPIIYNSK